MTFEVNGKTYKTDAATLEQLRQYRDNAEMFGIVMTLGSKAGRIVALGQHVDTRA